MVEATLTLMKVGNASSWHPGRKMHRPDHDLDACIPNQQQVACKMEDQYGTRTMLRTRLFFARSASALHARSALIDKNFCTRGLSRKSIKGCVVGWVLGTNEAPGTSLHPPTQKKSLAKKPDRGSCEGGALSLSDSSSLRRGSHTPTHLA